MKTLLSALALAVLPTFALAMGCASNQTTAQMSCADGMVFDADTQSCVPTTG